MSTRANLSHVLSHTTLVPRLSCGAVGMPPGTAGEE